MRRCLFRFLLLGTVLSCAVATQAQPRAVPALPPTSAPKHKPTAPLPPDRTSTVAQRPPATATARLDELHGDREFRYNEVATSTAPSPWERFWYRFWRAVGRLLGHSSYHGFWRWVVYALLAGAVVFVVLKLLDVDLTAAFGRAPRRSTALDYDTAAENIHELDFATRLREAEDIGNYRLALRLGYLEVLKHLTDQGLIDWQPNKTNHAYLRELADSYPTARAPFGELTRQFEYVWYGELALAAASYQQARAAQQQLGQQLGPAGRRSAA
jgi:hypothetical protein